jgi:hypothetical protein
MRYDGQVREVHPGYIGLIFLASDRGDILATVTLSNGTGMPEQYPTVDLAWQDVQECIALFRREGEE